jgi:hypothetical protein
VTGGVNQSAGASVPLTTEQEAMWLADVRNQLEGAALLEKLIIIENVWLDEFVAAEHLALRAAALVQSNENLRCAIEVQDGQVVRRVVAPYIPALCRIDQGQFCAASEVNSAIERMHQALISEIDMSTGALMAVGLLEVGNRCSVFLAAHHITCDDQSMQRLKAALLNMSCGVESLVEPSLSTLQPRRTFVTKESEIERWQQKSADLRPMVDGPGGNGTADYGDTSVANLALDPNLAQRVKNLASSTRTTVFMVLLTIFQLFVADVMRTRYPVVLSMRSTRRRADKHSAGLWVEPVIFAWNIDSHNTFHDLLLLSRQEVLAALSATAPFVSLAKEVPAIADLMTDDRHILLMFQHIGARPDLSADLASAEHDAPHSGLRVVPVDMAWWVHDVGDSFHIRTLSRDRVIAPAEAEKLLSDFEQFTHVILARDLDAPIIVQHNISNDRRHDD